MTPHSPETQALIDEAAHLSAKVAMRLEIAATLGSGILGSQGWPWSERDGADRRAECADRFANRVLFLADAILAASRTQPMTVAEVKAAAVFAADRMHEAQ